MTGHRQKTIQFRLRSVAQLGLSCLLLISSSGLSAVAQTTPTYTQAGQKQAPSRTPFCVATYDAQVIRTSSVIGLSYRALADQNRWAEALTLLQVNLRQIASLNAAASKLVALQDIPFFLAEAINDESFDPDLKTQVMPIADMTFDQFQSIAQTTNDAKLDPLARLALIYHRLGNSEKANVVLNQANTVVRTIIPLPQRIVALTTLADAYGTTGNLTQATNYLEQAIQLAKRIRSTPEAPEAQAESLWLITSHYAKLGDIASAIEVAQPLSEPFQGYAYAEIFFALIQQNNPDQMLELIPNLISPEQQVSALSRLGEYQAQHNKLDQAKTHFEQALTIARGLDSSKLEAQVLASYGQWFPETTLPMAQALTQPQDIAIALLPIALHYGFEHPEGLGNQLMAQIFAQQAKMNQDELWVYFTFALDKILQAEEYPWALEFAQNIPTTEAFGNLQEAAFRSIAVHGLDTNRLDITFQAVSRTTTNLSGDRYQFMDKVIDYALAQGELEKAILVSSQFPSDVPVETIQALAKIAPYFYPTDPARSTAIFNLARQQIDALSDINQKASGLAALSAGYFLTEQTEIANQTFNELLQMAKADPIFADFSPLLEAKLYAQAFTFAQTVPPKDSFFTPAPTVVIDTLFTQAPFSAQTATLAEQLIASTQKPEIKTDLWLKLASYHQALGQREQAVATLQNATTAALTIPDPEVRSDYRYPYDDITDRASQLESIALYYAYLNQPQSASQVASKIQTADLRAALEDKLACF
jgi:tetratricopeptide (TPR) repeat protein